MQFKNSFLFGKFAFWQHSYNEINFTPLINNVVYTLNWVSKEHMTLQSLLLFGNIMPVTVFIRLIDRQTDNDLIFLIRMKQYISHKYINQARKNWNCLNEVGWNDPPNWAKMTQKGIGPKLLQVQTSETLINHPQAHNYRNT